MIFVELYRQIRRLRTWIALSVLAILPTIAAIANRSHRNGGNDPSFGGLATFSSASGLNHAFLALAFMSQFFLVVVTANFAGESIAGEANWGTLRALLTRPVGRAKLLTSKLLVSFILAAGATTVIALAGLISGTIAFGLHPLLLPFKTVAVGAALVKLLLVTAYIAWSMTFVVTFAILISTFTDHAGGAIAAGVGLGVVSQIHDALPSLSWLHPYLPTHYLDAWTQLLVRNPVAGALGKGLLIQLLYGAVFVSLAFRRFLRKDILS